MKEEIEERKRAPTCSTAGVPLSLCRSARLCLGVSARAASEGKGIEEGEGGGPRPVERVVIKEVGWRSIGNASVKDEEVGAEGCRRGEEEESENRALREASEGRRAGRDTLLNGKRKQISQPKGRGWAAKRKGQTETGGDKGKG